MSWGTPAERFWEKVNKNGPVPAKLPELGPCWLWTGGKKKAGYGQFSVNNKKVIAHRWAYKHFVADVPDHLEVHHMCDNSSCVNFETHLKVVTVAENRKLRDINKTHCIHGHEYTPENTGYQRGHSGKMTNRYCKECNKIKARRRYNS